MVDFPSNLPNIPNPGSTLGITGGSSGHGTIHARIEEEIIAIATRLGTLSEANMTLASGVVAHASGWLSPASSKSAGMVVTRGRLLNSSGGSLAAGVAIAQVGLASHFPSGNLTFTATLGSGASVSLDVNSSGQLVLATAWANGVYLNIGGFVWWV